MSTCLILPCAGSGSRLNKRNPNNSVAKQLRLIAGDPVFIHSLRPFVNLVDQILIPCPSNLRSAIQDALDTAGIAAVLVNGGATRMESITLALAACPADCDKILIHDAVRPCIHSSIIQACLDGLDQHDAVLTAIPCTDTLKQCSNDHSLRTLDRSHIYLAQTPQGFHAQLPAHSTQRSMHHAYSTALSDGIQYTDDASVCEALGLNVIIIPGSRDNIKITYPEDLDLAAYLLAKA